MFRYLHIILTESLITYARFKINKMVTFIQVIDRKSIDLFIFCHYHLHNKCHHFMNFVKIPHIITDSVRMMYKHRNVWE